MNRNKPSESHVLRAATKKLPIVADRKLSQQLQWVADDMAHAYRIGAEEAQAEIVYRLRDLYRKAKSTDPQETPNA